MGAGCFDCGLPYASDLWIETFVRDAEWRAISPDGEGNGLLCIACIAKRCAAKGMKKVPVAITAGPLMSVTTPRPKRVVTVADLLGRREVFVAKRDRARVRSDDNAACYWTEEIEAVDAKIAAATPKGGAK